MICKGDHWSAKCPHKSILQDIVPESAATSNNNDFFVDKMNILRYFFQKGSTGAYRPPALRAGANSASTAGKKMDSGKGKGLNLTY